MAVEFIDLSREDFLKEYEHVYRFMPLNRLLQIFDKKELTFVYPGLWNDPFEKIFLEADYSINGSQFDLPIKDRLYSLCWSKTRESEAFWNTYISLHNGVRIKVKAEKLLLLLEAFSNKSAYKVYIGRVKYLEFDQIMKYKNDKVFVAKLNSRSINNSHIELMLLKRKAFEYENEIRILLYPNAARSNKTYGLPIDPLQLIADYRIDPRTDEYISDMIKSYFKDKYKLDFNKSRLYEKLKLSINI